MNSKRDLRWHPLRQPRDRPWRTGVRRKDDEVNQSRKYRRVRRTPARAKVPTDVTYDTASKMLTWKVTYSGLTGPARHIFVAPPKPAERARRRFPLRMPPAAQEGSATLTDAQPPI
jgi:hypothetical protein